MTFPSIKIGLCIPVLIFWQQKMRSYSLETPFGNFAFLEWGREHGFPILCFHGWLDNAHSFLPLAESLIPYLEEKNIRLLAMDFLGHGHSSHKPPGVFYHYLDYVAEMRYVVKRFGFSSYSILGHSMGGGLAVLYSAAFPDGLKKLILMEALGPLSREVQDMVSSFRDSVEQAVAWVEKGPKESYFPRMDDLVRLRIRAGKMEESSARILLERGTQFTEKGYFLLRDPRLILPSFVRFTEDMVLEFLKNITVPVTIILGSQGMIPERSTTKERIAAIPNCKTYTIEGGHHLHMDKPKEVADILKKEWEVVLT